MKGKSDHPKILLVRTLQGLAPATEYDMERLTRYGVGSQVEGRFWQNRSQPHHRLYWVILAIVAQNNEVWTTAEAVHRNIKRALGYVQTYYDFFGVEQEEVMSTAFDAMDQAAFREYFDLAMELIRLHFKIDADKLIEEGKRRLAPQRHIPYHGAQRNEHSARQHQ